MHVVALCARGTALSALGVNVLALPTEHSQYLKFVYGLLMVIP
jgi:hypothetical protein